MTRFQLKTAILERISNIKWTCEHNKENADFLKTLPDELKKNVLTVLYEEIANEPYDQANRILKFAELEMTSKIETFVKENTVSTTGKAYSLHKNATESAFKWRKELSLDEIREIEDVCSEMMNIYSYDVYKPSLN